MNVLIQLYYSAKCLTQCASYILSALSLPEVSNLDSLHYEKLPGPWDGSIKRALASASQESRPPLQVREVRCVLNLVLIANYMSFRHASLSGESPHV